MMEKEAYDDWILIYNRYNVFDVYKSERKELQIAAMLITALKNELKNIQEECDIELVNLRAQLKEKDNIKGQIKSSFSENVNPKFIQKTKLDSPDVFQNSLDFLNKTPTTLNTWLPDDDNTSLETSPTLFSKRKIKPRKPHVYEGLKKNITKDLNKENTILIDCTPELKQSSRKKSRFTSKKKNLTCTQMFSNMAKNDSTNIKKHNEKCENDTTYLKEDSELGVTELLGLINTSEQNSSVSDNQNEGEINSSYEIDQLSKGILYGEESPLIGSPKKKFKVANSFVEPKLRGKAKKALKGFSCAQCRDFYSGMNLSPEKLEKKMDECSKHRYKYAPPEDTFPGIWAMTIMEPQNVLKKDKPFD